MKIRPFRFESIQGDKLGWDFWCIGCGRMHMVLTSSPDGIGHHTFNGDVDAPTFSPPIIQRVSAGEWVDDGMGREIWLLSGLPRVYCYVDVKNGMLRYGSDGDHYLVNFTVPMVDLPTTREERTELVRLHAQLSKMAFRRQK